MQLLACSSMMDQLPIKGVAPSSFKRVHRALLTAVSASAAAQLNIDDDDVNIADESSIIALHFIIE